MELLFEKYNGLGNDFIILSQEIEKEKIIKLCDRKFGIGADGLIVLQKKDENYFMKFFNQDGSIASMCGNGIRCYAHYLYNKELIKKDKEILIDTLAGIKKIKIISENPFEVKVSMGEAKELNLNQYLTVNNKEYKYHYVNTGVEHIVIYVNKDELNLDFIKDMGEKIQLMKEIFPNSININFCFINDLENIELITYERGVGITLACGTGACAAAYISKFLNLVKEEVNVKLMGGNLKILISDSIYMTGKSEFVFKGSMII